MESDASTVACIGDAVGEQQTQSPGCELDRAAFVRNAVGDAEREARHVARSGFLEVLASLARKISGGGWPALTNVTSCLTAIEQAGTKRDEAVEQTGLLHVFVELVDRLGPGSAR